MMLTTTKLPVLVINMYTGILSKWEIHFEYPLLTSFGWPNMMDYCLLARLEYLPVLMLLSKNKTTSASKISTEWGLEILLICFTTLSVTWTEQRWMVGMIAQLERIWKGSGHGIIQVQCQRLEWLGKTKKNIRISIQLDTMKPNIINVASSGCT